VSSPAPTRRQAALFVILLAVLVGLRLWAAPQARFTGDESHQWSVARMIAEGRTFPAYGLEITGSAARLPGPACYVLVALPQLFGASPLLGSAFVVLLHALAGLMFAHLASRARGPRAGVLALAVLAFAPWDVLYGDRIWGSSLAPVWAAVAIWAAVEAPRRPAAQGILLFFALTLPQLHLSAPIAWVSIGVLLWLHPVGRWKKSAVAWGLAATVLAYSPMLVAELSSGFANTRAILGRGGGDETWDTLWQVPFRVFGYAVLYASSAIDYHFARGYWGGGFDDLARFGTTAGWRAAWAREGAVLGALGLSSIALAAVAWMEHARQLARELVARRRSLESALTWSLLAGLGAGAALMMLAHKKFFPHYANVLVPLALWPVVASLDRWLDRGPAARAAALLALALSSTSMALQTVRYYREVDGLNGLTATVEMVERVLAEPGPVRLEFAHFHNEYAWGQVARVLFGRELRTHPRAPVTFRVHNDRRAEGPLGEGESLHGAVRLERRPPSGGGLLGSPQRERWRAWEVEAERADGSRRACAPREDACAYGDQPWQRFGPDLLEVDGQPRPLLFLHPIEGATVRARLTVDAAVRAGVLRYALSDGAVASGNTAPVELRLVERTADSPDSHELARASAENRRGLFTLPFTRTASGAGALELEIRTASEGARVFGFDLDLERPSP
jgi:hypothetical protein